MNKLTTKTKITIGVIILVIAGFVFLKIHPETAVAPVENNTSSTAGQSQYPVLDTASTTSVTLKLGDHISVENVILTPTEVLQDSRCASGLACVQAGTLVLAVNASSDDGADVIDLPLGKAVTQDGLTTTLIDVTPAQVVGQKINPTDYAFTLTIEPVISDGIQQ